jgi:tripartite-type tricarboxylate transporter receptor subunit TctC
VSRFGGEGTSLGSAAPITRRRRLLSAAALLHLGAARTAGGQTRAADWPRRTVRVVVPYAAGGGTDIFVRTLAEGLRPILGQAVVVENRPGANGAVGSEAVARGEADGHLFLVPTGSHVMNRYAMASLPYDPVRDFAPVTLLSRFPMVLVASNAAPFRDVAGLIAAARAAPRSVGFGTSDAAISYAGNAFARAAGIEMTEVPYRGGGPLMNDLVAGHIPTGWNSTLAALAHIQSGRVRALGVTTAPRSHLLPEVPTLAEAGAPGYEFAGWYGLVGPAALPAEIAARLHAAIEAALAEPALRARLRDLGADLNLLGPADFAAYLRDDDARWARAAQAGLVTRAQ